MDVILLERMPKVGTLGQRVRVKPGFARNFLIPQGKALPATAANLVRFEARRVELERVADEQLKQAQQRAAQLEGVSVSIAAQTGEEGRLFGSVTTQDIARALAAAGHTVPKADIKLLESIRNVGDYEVEVHLQGEDCVARIKVSVISS